MRQPDFLELTVCDNCDLATANETMSLLITSFVSDGTASSNASNHTLLTEGSLELMSLITRGRKEEEKMWVGIRFLDKATPRLHPAAVWISVEAPGRFP
jgi:hypothetical protein